MTNEAEKGDLSLDSYVNQLTDYKEKAKKVFGMGSPNPNLNYVIKALDAAIQVAQGKGNVNEEEIRDVMRSTEALTKRAIKFYSQGINANQESKESAQDSQANNAGGFNNR